MAILDLIEKFFASSDRSTAFGFTPDLVDGGYFSVEKSQFEKIKNGEANGWLTQQFILFKMLEEQGHAESIPNGFIISADVLVRLDEYSRAALSLPDVWQGNIVADIKGVTSRSSFTIDLLVTDPDGLDTHSYEIVGPIIQFGESAEYLLSSAQLMAFDARKNHQVSERSEFDNLTYLHNLQLSQKANASIRLKHFDKLKIHTPEKITVEAELDKYGDLILTPHMGQATSYEDIQRVLGQIMAPNVNTLKCGYEIILLTEDKVKAVQEVLENRVVPQNRIKEFLENPSAFIDASLVDLDLGFSIRVRGATAFKHAYFGETDDSGINWFDQSASSQELLPFNKIVSGVKDSTTLSQLEAMVSDAIQTRAAEMDFEGKTYDISDLELVDEIIEKIKHRIKEGITDEASDSDDKVGENSDDGLDKAGPEETIVVDIDLNDEDLSEHSPLVESKIADVCREGDLDWSNYIRTPFKHQVIGVRWILGLFDQMTKDAKISGALLADDMGLGKTFMALSAVEHHYREQVEKQQTQKPILIIAPLSLLQNWKDEVAETFEKSPFKDIVILQTNGELNRFRHSGVEIRSQSNSDGEFEPRYSLNIGKRHSDRLDMPGRLVIATYQTLRDYQFSLCLVDWGFVIFDEAQNIKNPNALQSRAAKGLKADFKLVATGTPVENSLADFWCLMDTACPGCLGGYQEFRSRYISPILQAAGDEVEEVRFRVGRELRIHVGFLMLRRVKEDNLEGLPAKNMFVGVQGDEWQYLPELGKTMSGYQLKVYDGAIATLAESESGHVLSTLQRLRSCSLHPRLADGGKLDVPTNNKELESIFNESEKLRSLIEIVDIIKGRQQKCIIFAVNKRLQAFLSLALGKKYQLGPLSIINGDAKAISKNTLTPTRKSMIAEFEAKQGFNIIVMSPVAAGVGLTVVGANNVVHFERHWNPAKEAQATDRVYRIGQKIDVNIYIPVLLHPKMESFDVNLHRLLSKKTLLKDAVITPEEINPMPGGMGVKSKFSDADIIKANEISKLSWQQFEALALEVISKDLKADSAWLTSSGADKGADGVVDKDNQLTLIQAKHTKGTYDGYEAIKEIVFAKCFYEEKMRKNNSKLIFVTNAPILSKRTRGVARECNVEILNGKDLSELVEKHQVTFKQILTRLDKKRLKV
jgi:SNF2 family DNA or RNA helicase